MAHLGGEREFQPAVQQGRRLAGARRADDGVPRLLVEVATRAPRFLEERQGGGHPFPEGGRFFARAVIGLLGGLLGDSAFQLLLATPVKQIERQVRRRPGQQQTDHDGQPRHPAFERRDQGAEQPDQQRQDGDADKTQHPTGEQESQCLHG